MFKKITDKIKETKIIEFDALKINKVGNDLYVKDSRLTFLTMSLCSVAGIIGLVSANQLINKIIERGAENVQ